MPEKKSEPRTLYHKLVEVMTEIGRVEKRGYNSFYKYAYVMESDLMEAVRQRLADRNVLLVPSLESCQHEDTLTTAILRFTFIDADSGERHEVQWAGTGDDKGDKGLYKAFTGAEKYFLMKMFLISTGDDPEGDTKTDERADQTAQRACPECGLSKSVIKGKEEYGGGWLCYKKKGGCGAKWHDEGQMNTEEALKKGLFEQAEKLMSMFAEDKRKDALGRLMLLSAADMAIKVSELAENMKERANLIISIESGSNKEEIDDYLTKNCEGKTLDTITLANLRKAEKDLSIPF